MLYPYMTLNDNTEIVHSELLEDNTVKVYIETPDAKDCFHHMTCYLPDYRIEEVFGFSDAKVEEFIKLIKANAHLIMQFASQGGFENAK